MAFNPDDYNLINYNGLSVSFSPQKGWLASIQDPDGDIITSITLEQLGLLLLGDIQLPDGVVSGLGFDIENSTTPKTGSVDAGSWRIANNLYTMNTQYSFNINSEGVTDRTDAIIADSTGAVYYQPNYVSLPADSILITTFIVPADGSDITIPVVSPVNYAVLNALNDGDIDISGQFKINGVPIGGGGGLTTVELTGSDLIDTGDETAWKATLPSLTENQSIIAMLKIFPDFDTPSNFYFKIPETEGNELINIEWDSISNIKILIKIG